MRKIVINDPKDFDELQRAFPDVSKSSIYRALNYHFSSMRASQIRCHAMNQLKSSYYFTSKNN